MNQYPPTRTAMPMTTIKIKQMIVMPAGSFNPMQSRPYQTFVDQNLAEDLVRRIHDAGPQSTTSSVVAGVANRLMQPSKQSLGVVPIANGWETPRGRFILSVEVSDSMGSVYTYHIQGYTSYLDNSLVSNHLDPRMDFIVNSYVKMMRASMIGPTGLQVRDIMTDRAQVINGRLMSGSTQGLEVYGMRPWDLYAVMHGRQMVGEVGGSISDERHIFTDKSMQTSRSNNMPSSIVTKLVDSYQNASALVNYGAGQSDLLTRARGIVHESQLGENIFFRALADITGLVDATTFTLGTLMAIDPHMPPVKFLRPSQKDAMLLGTAGRDSYWHDPNDRSAWVATVLQNTVPTIMMDLMATRMAFRTNNHSPGGIPNFALLDARDLAGRPIEEVVEPFKARFFQEVMFDLSRGGQDTYSIMMDLDLFGQTIIDLAINTSAPVRFTSPSFCDGLFTPVITGFEQVVQNNATDITTVLNGIAAASRPMGVNQSV